MRGSASGPQHHGGLLGGAGREGFYWLTVLVTFALGTAVGDWTLELTGWSAGVSVLPPLGLIVAVLASSRPRGLAAGRRAGAVVLAGLHPDPTPGANIGDFLASSRADGGLGLGIFGTSVIFLGTILIVVVYLTVSRRDTTDSAHLAAVDQPAEPQPAAAAVREG